MSNRAMPLATSQFKPPTGEIFFPLASNAHALVAGAGVASVRARLKMASLLYNRVLLEPGLMNIEGGPHGMWVARPPEGERPETTWQTPRSRKQDPHSYFQMTADSETELNGIAFKPGDVIIASEVSLSWTPTFEPFKQELTGSCDWIDMDGPSDTLSSFEDLEEASKRRDDSNDALAHLVPEPFIRSRLVNHVSHDLALGASRGLDVSVDRRHGRVIAARFSADSSVRAVGFALPVLVPGVRHLEWSDVARIRRMPAIARLRQVLHEVEIEALEVARSGGDVEAAMHTAYARHVREAVTKVEGVLSTGASVLTDLVVGVGTGYATLSFSTLGPLAGAAATAVVTGGLHVRQIARMNARRAWVGVVDAITESVPNLS